MSKFNNTIKSYIEEQNITFNADAAKTTTIPENPQLDKAADVMSTVKNLLQGQVKQTPEEFEKALVTAFTPFGVKTAEDAYKMLETFGFKKQEQLQQPDQSDLNKKTIQNPTQQAASQQTSTPKAPQSAYSSMPKA
jgi:hypothetical protein